MLHKFLLMAVFDVCQSYFVQINCFDFFGRQHLLSIAVIFPAGDIFSCHAVDNPDFESEMVSR